MNLMILSISSGILLGTAFPPIPTGVTAFVGFIPFLFMVERVEKTTHFFKYAYITFLTFNVATIYWISGWSGDDIWLKLSGIAVNLVHPFFFFFPALLYFFIRKRYGLRIALIAFPFIWVTYEWLSQIPEISFPWLILANTQTYNIWGIQFISLTGAFGASFWIVSVNVVLFYLLWRFLDLHSCTGLIKENLFTTCLLFILLFAPFIHSFVVMDATRSTGSVRVGICQPDMDPYDKWGSGDTPKDKLNNLLAQYDSLRSHGLDLILMPETAIPFRILMQTYSDELMMIRKRVDSIGVPLLTGFADTKIYEEGAAPHSAKKFTNSNIRFDDFNSAALFIPESYHIQIYHKIKLTPMSERIPMLDAFPFLADLLTWGVGISGWGIGRDTTVFSLPLKTAHGDSTHFWSMICYETLYPKFISTFVDRGAEFLTVITNDGWFGRTSGPYQLQQYAVLRAIENRRAIARCANNGISCFIDPYGRVKKETVLYTRTTIHDAIPLIQEKTFYTRHGDWFALICACTTGLLVVGSFFFKRNER